MKTEINPQFDHEQLAEHWVAEYSGMDAEGAISVVLSGVTVSNGLAWSPDGTHGVPRGQPESNAEQGKDETAGPDGLLRQLTKTELETALNATLEKIAR
jgi:hypothetical protein